MSSTAPEIQPHILAVDDDPDHLALIKRWLNRAGLLVSCVHSGEQALDALETDRPDLVLTDLIMDGMDGLKLLSEIHRHDPVMPVLILSGNARIPDAIRAAHLGVSSFLTKPITAPELVQAVRSVLDDVGERNAGSGSRFAKHIIHRSYAMAEVLKRARLVAMGDSTVLLAGDTGTGKELVAQAIHQAGSRAGMPFVSVNCGALPDQLLESELFGHEKGAFTGALRRHEGLFQAANGGTLFLDEIGDMPLAVQAKLLRVLQDFQVRPVGSTRAVPVNVRIISATHQDLDDMVEKGEFRRDLFYRLNVVPLTLPSLAERREDIPLLIDYFLKLMAGGEHREHKRFAPEAMEYLVAAKWRGNIRQLRNVVEQCTVLCTSDVIPLTLARSAMQDRATEILPLDEARFAFERRYLLGVLHATLGNVSASAKLAGRNRTEFYKLLNRHGLEPANFRAHKDE